ncbi:uncharacterized protein AMSG_01288 [Thecamonas trahens ATCC 50062]|uniref:Fe2OG dioxygenase domain-containing protein n=1 Tax=Thecamonas trahens ATCC 50062 TaxID=461836 RepID=A0A0L0DQA4_THETB|nr:hypothetical protein AMSG_01288 [Thecamonas trahens ATCC 50062]KNC53578.1 hypothetical protein AMSG_01288 [Thecamonas trahens ATCC 50062]|eukprot:XP_013761895.1 hypothetical protein AMSG_01288 [Thecamonas trahens ATCC 50062]
MASYTGLAVSDEILKDKLELELPGRAGEDSADGATGVTTRAVDGVDGVTVSDGVLTAAQCAALIEQGFGERASSHPVMWRRWADDPEAEERKLGRRTIFSSPEAAAVMWEFVSDLVPETVETTTGGDRQVWAKRGLSPRLKFITYATRQDFPSHYDGPYVESPQRQSFFSLEFLARSSKFADPSECEVVASVPPAAGRVVIMPHRRLHKSSPVKGGRKYMIRCDAVYDLVESEQVDAATD